MNFGQLIELNMKNIFPEKSYSKCGEVASPIPFKNELDSRSTVWNVIVCFYCAQVEVYQNVKPKVFALTFYNKVWN